MKQVRSPVGGLVGIEVWVGVVTPDVGLISADAFAVLVFALLGLIVGAAMLIFSEILGPKRRDPEKNTIYECGVPLLDSARHPFTVKFYLVAILFILFDIETVFLIPYAVVFKRLGIGGLVEVLLFIAVLGAGLLYCWKRGALEWD